MRGDVMWVDVTSLMTDGIEPWFDRLNANPDAATSLGLFIKRLNQLATIKDISFHVEEVTGEDKTIEVVVDIFNRVNSGGTKLSKGDLALAKICAELPTARDSMQETLARWREGGYHFNLALAAAQRQ